MSEQATPATRAAPDAHDDYLLGSSDLEHQRLMVLAAEIVGPRGRVLGIELDPVVTDKARRRARNPAATLRRFARFLRPGGLVVLHEFDLTVQNPSWPPCPPWDDSYRLLTDVYRAIGTPPDFGRRLNRTFLDAGLPAPEVECQAPVAAGSDSPIVPWLAYTLRSIAPVPARAGLPLPAGLVADDTLPDQLEKAVLEHGSQVLGALQYGAWTRVP